MPLHQAFPYLFADGSSFMSFVVTYENGEFVDYQENSCQTRKLSLSCVYPTSSTDDKMHLDSVATEIHEFALENWAVENSEG